MKCVLVNGQNNGEVWDLAFRPKTILCSSKQRYMFYTQPFFSPEIALYTCEDWLPKDEAKLRELVCRLNKKDCLVALNEWIDEQFANRIYFAVNHDRLFRGDLFKAAVPFEFAMVEIDNRRTAARLRRRFADVCPDFLDAAAKLTEKSPMATPLDDDENGD